MFYSFTLYIASVIGIDRNVKPTKMKVTTANAKFIVKNGTKRINQTTKELIGYDLPVFYRFRNVFICKDAVSGYMVINSNGDLSDGVIYKDFDCCESARKVLNLY